MTEDHDPTLAALREREAELREELVAMDIGVRILQAKHTELLKIIDLIARGGRRKPGPKPRVVAEAPVSDQPTLESTLRASLALPESAA